MDMGQYKAEFVSDARDHLDSLNENLLLLEKEPGNQEVINTLFRAFHTLKGNAGMMGYKRFSDLAHALEDVLGRFREGQLRPGSDVFELLYEGCDTLELALASVEKDDPEGIDVDQLIIDLHGLIAGEAEKVKAEKVQAEMKVSFDLGQTERDEAERARAEGLLLFRVVVVFDPKNPLKNAKGLLVARDLGSIGRLIQLVPAKELIANGDFGTEIAGVIATEEPKESIAKRFGAIFGVRHVDVLGLDEKYEKPSHIAHEEREHAKETIARQHQTAVAREIRSVKVEMERLDKLMNLVGELLISNIRLQGVSKQAGIGLLQSVSQGIDRLILDLQDQVMRIRMVPIDSICRRYPRMVRDLAEKEGKKVELLIEGAETEFDRTVLDQMGEPLVHLLRNGVDHGIEPPEERRAAGKPETGTIRLSVRRARSHAVLELSDDGRGIDVERVKRESVRKRVISEAEAERLSEDEIRMLIFRPGVSTAERVTEVSGRGVGMDVVLNKVRELGGNVQLRSAVGKGTTITIRLPLTLAILSALLVRSGEDVFALPLSSVERIVDIEPGRIKTMQGHEVFIHRGQDVPLFRLSRLVGGEERSRKVCTVVVVSRAEREIGIIVDEIVSQQQVLIKGLGDLVKGTKGCAGVTILSDGSVVLVLDLETLF